MLFIYTTIKEKTDVQALAEEVINAKLAACADYWPTHSTYLREGKTVSVDQYMVVFTTHSEYASELEAYITAKHPYTVPMVARTQIDVINNAYQQWANETTRA